MWYPVLVNSSSLLKRSLRYWDTYRFRCGSWTHCAAFLRFSFSGLFVFCRRPSVLTFLRDQLRVKVMFACWCLAPYPPSPSWLLSRTLSDGRHFFCAIYRPFLRRKRQGKPSWFANYFGSVLVVVVVTTTFYSMCARSCETRRHALTRSTINLRLSDE